MKGYIIFAFLTAASALLLGTDKLTVAAPLCTGALDAKNIKTVLKFYCKY